MVYRKLLIVVIPVMLLLVGCGAPIATPTLTTTAPMPATATPASTPIPPTATPLPPTPTPVPAMTATAEAFGAAIQATAVAAQPTLAAVQSQMNTAVRCSDIPADPLMLTSPVPLPAEIGQAWDGQAVIFRVPPGTVVRAPIDGSIRLGPWRITPLIDYMTITREDVEVLVGFPRRGYQSLLPAHNFRGVDVKRGEPIARVDGSTVEAPPGGIVGLDAFNVIVELRMPVQRVPPYGGGEPIPLEVFGDLWYGGLPTACQDWSAEPTPAVVAQATPTPMPTVAPVVATPPPYTGSIPTPTGHIAFFATADDGSTEIFVVDLPDGTSHQVTHREWVLSWRSFLGWHPDGEHLFFYTSEPEREKRKIVLLDQETGEGEIVPNFPTSGLVYLDWSPDGSRLLWATGKTLYVADAGNRDPKPIFNGSSDIAEPIWSPDGQQIAFVMQRQGDQSKEVYLISAQGGNATRVTDFYTDQPSQSPFSPEMMVWAPDGKHIAFTLRSGQYPDETINLCTVALVDQETSCIGDLPVGISGSFAWLPSSQHIVFQDGFEIYVIDVRSGEVLNLTHHPARDQIPYYTADQVVSPDGQFLVFASDRDHWKGEIYVLHIPSGEVVARITADFTEQWDAVWSRR